MRYDAIGRGLLQALAADPDIPAMAESDPFE